MARRPAKKRRSRTPRDARPPGLRIIGGQFRGRRLVYHGDPRTRPMKDRLREAVFNLVGPAVRQTHAIDLFAGTGALALEALSRGAARATLIERHHPTAAVIRQNIAELDVAAVTELVVGDTFHWARRLPEPGATPWLVFCSPPYALYHDRPEQMLTLIAALRDAAPAGSMLVVEADTSFDMDRLPAADWDVRRYGIAQVGLARLAGAS